MGNDHSKVKNTALATKGGYPVGMDLTRRPEQPGTCWVHSLALPVNEDLPEPTGPESYERLALLGKGCFGSVYLVRRVGGERLYAMKSLNKKHLVDRDEVEHTRAERLILGTMRHPFIVRMNRAFQSPTKLYIILEVITGGELFFHLKKDGRFDEDRARFYAAELVLALEYLHERGIIYRDLKPENILLDNEGHIVLTDFGLSKRAGCAPGSRSSSVVGTPEYVAPEIILERGHDKCVDWWALGTVLYELLAGLPPFYSQDTDVMYRRILAAPLTFPSTMSVEARSLIAALLDRNPQTRLGAGPKGSTAIKQHPFFANVDWLRVFNRQDTPPFVPTQKEAESLRYVDAEFRDQPMLQPAALLNGETPLPEGMAGTFGQQFAGFTYVGSAMEPQMGGSELS